MKFETLPRFDSDFRRLKPEHQRLFLRVIHERFAPACELYTKDPATPWPKALRVKPVVDTRGVFEMTWSFTGPDGRATFELVSVDGELRCRWRRIGDHSVFGDP